jgi:hypothetical protein
LDPVSEIWDPEKIHPGSGSWIQGVKKHQIPDPDPQHWFLVKYINTVRVILFAKLLMRLTFVCIFFKI